MILGRENKAYTYIIHYTYIRTSLLYKPGYRRGLPVADNWCWKIYCPSIMWFYYMGNTILTCSGAGRLTCLRYIQREFGAADILPQGKGTIFLLPRVMQQHPQWVYSTSGCNRDPSKTEQLKAALHCLDNKASIFPMWLGQTSRRKVCFCWMFSS